MIIGTHIMIQSANEAADKAFFRDVLKLPHVDAGGGFLLFGVPPSEVAIHEGTGDAHELFLMCEDIEDFLANMSELGVGAAPAMNRGWGIISEITLPGGGKLNVYQPLHKRPVHATAKRGKKVAKRAAKKPAKKKAAKKKVAKKRAKRR